MGQRTISRQFLTLAILIAMSMGCTRSLSRSITFDHLDGGAFDEVLSHVHEGTWDNVDLRMRFRLRGGSVTAVLTDPEGVVRWQEIYTGPTSEREHQRLSGVDGSWTLELRSEDARGSYRASLASS